MKKQAKTDKVLRSDNGGRRSGAERRSFSYTYYIPERRTGKDRRHGNGCRTSLRPEISSETPTSLEDDPLNQTGPPS